MAFITKLVFCPLYCIATLSVPGIFSVKIDKILRWITFQEAAASLLNTDSPMLCLLLSRDNLIISFSHISGPPDFINILINVTDRILFFDQSHGPSLPLDFHAGVQWGQPESSSWVKQLSCLAIRSRNLTDSKCLQWEFDSLVIEEQRGSSSVYFV